MESEGSLLFIKGLPLVPILSQMNPVHTPKPYFPKTYLFFGSRVVSHDADEQNLLMNYWCP
jgi:hypothetical protein